MEDNDDFAEVKDDVPRLEEQARLLGWKAGIFNFGKGEREGVSFFNPGLVRRPDGLWLIARRSVDYPSMPYGKNDICAFHLDETTMIPKVGYPLKVPNSGELEQFEDPRAFRWGEQTWIGMVNFSWFDDGSWTGAHQCLASYRDDEEWTPIVRRDPPVETNRGEAGHTNGRHNKNFLWFIHEGKLCLIYSSDPWHTVEFGASWDEQKHYRSEGARYDYGHIRGGTTPVRVGDLYWSFFHSSMPWRGRFRRYFMGAYAFEAKPPFLPVLVTPEPILTGSQNNRWFQRKPLVVFPCGALLENDMWTVTFGSNDLESGWVKIPHDDLVKLAQPKPAAAVSLLLAETTAVPVYEAIMPELNGVTPNITQHSPSVEAELVAYNADVIKAAKRERMARARAALAAKRAQGWKPKRRIKRRKRRTTT